MASTGDTWRLGHRPALDGLRGVAILLVLAGHGWAPLRLGAAGKIGVAVFFTLSGFLITSLLVEEHARRGGVNLRRFYRNRALRLVPAQVMATTVLVLAGFALGAWYMTPMAATAAYLYFSNLLPYFGLVGHFWSLAVEEQFYLLWAPLLVWLLGRGSPRRLVPLVVAFAVLSLTLRLRFSDVTWGQFSAEASLPLQADALFAGCALALFMHGRRERVSRPGLMGGCVGAWVALAFLPMEAATSWGITAAGLVTVTALWAVGQGDGVSWLKWTPLVWLGRRSYALYLWHYPIGFVVWQVVGITAWLPFLAIVAPLSLGLTVLSWRFVEFPFLAMKRRSVDPVEPAQHEPDQGVVLSGERLHLGDDLSVAR